jgi:hypothetical protein
VLNKIGSKPDFIESATAKVGILHNDASLFYQFLLIHQPKKGGIFSTNRLLKNGQNCSQSVFSNQENPSNTLTGPQGLFDSLSVDSKLNVFAQM